MSATDGTQLRIVQLALAAAFGQGHESRDVVELTGEVLAELFALRTTAAANTELGEQLRLRTDSLRELAAAVSRLLAAGPHQCGQSPKCPVCDSRDALSAFVGAISARFEA